MANYTPEEKAKIEAYRALKKPDLIMMANEIGKDAVVWLVEKMKEEKEYKVYPRKTIILENGKKKSFADKTQEPTIKKDIVSFVDVKYSFIEKFKPEMLPPKKKGSDKSFADMVAELAKQYGL